MDQDAVRDAAFCQRHREITREQGKEIARERLQEARRTGAEWVVLFDDVTPFGSHRLEMHVRQRPCAPRLGADRADGSRPPTSSRSCSWTHATARGCWIKPPLMPTQKYTRHDEWEARIAQARELFGKDRG